MHLRHGVIDFLLLTLHAAANSSRDSQRALKILSTRRSLQGSCGNFLFGPTVAVECFDAMIDGTANPLMDETIGLVCNFFVWTQCSGRMLWCHDRRANPLLDQKFGLVTCSLRVFLPLSLSSLSLSRYSNSLCVYEFVIICLFPITFQQWGSTVHQVELDSITSCVCWSYIFTS